MGGITDVQSEKIQQKILVSDASKKSLNFLTIKVHNTSMDETNHVYTLVP